MTTPVPHPFARIAVSVTVAQGPAGHYSPPSVSTALAVHD